MKFFYLICLFFGLISCERGVKSDYDYNIVPVSNAIITDMELGLFTEAIEKTVYVPIYSNISNYDQAALIPLQVLLSIRNTDMKNNLRIESIIYFDTNGKKLRDFIKSPIEIKAFGSYEVVVKTSDLEGGIGAKILVKWMAADATIQKPLIESVTTGFTEASNISFSSRGVTLD